MTALREQFSWPLALQCILAYHFNKPSDGTTVRIAVSHAAGPRFDSWMELFLISNRDKKGKPKATAN